MNRQTQEDFFRAMCGPRIGSGCYRDVYESQLRSDIVVKIEREENTFINIYEWQLYSCAKNLGMSEWLAPCVFLSPNGKVLVQKMTEGVPFEMLPQFIPEYLTDTKKDNWGLYNGRVVCHDYGTHLALEKGITKKVKEVNWRC